MDGIFLVFVFVKYIIVMVYVLVLCVCGILDEFEVFIELDILFVCFF